MKVKFTYSQFTSQFLTPPSSNRLSGYAMVGAMQGLYEIEVDIDAADLGTLMSGASGVSGSTVYPAYAVVDGSGDISKLLLVQNGGSGAPYATVLFNVSGAYALSTLTGLFPSAVIIQASDIVAD